MHTPKNTWLHWSVTVPVLLLYLLFFAVQIFFNLDVTQRNLVVSETTAQLSHVPEHHPAKIAGSVNKTSLKTKVRLNKRFEPSNIPFSVASVTEPVICYAEPVNSCSYVSAFYTSAELAVQSLRGPPVVA
ncbi:MAG: hypothetical protein V4450_03570 [Bacteroidota bacterium]